MTKTIKEFFGDYWIEFLATEPENEHCGEWIVEREFPNIAIAQGFKFHRCVLGGTSFSEEIEEYKEKLK